eukprot:5011917-Alexandrium_andersonii.AAC.1
MSPLSERSPVCLDPSAGGAAEHRVSNGRLRAGSFGTGRGSRRSAASDAPARGGRTQPKDSDAAVLVPSEDHRTCLLYTSPSPRD